MGTCKDKTGKKTGVKQKTGAEVNFRPSSSLSYARPRMRFKLVPHSGHLPLAMRVPLSLTTTLPVAVRFALHFTQ